MSDEILSKLTVEVASRILRQPGRKIKPDEALISGGVIDSFSLVDLALMVEDVFGVRLDDTELNAGTFDTLQQLADLIASRQS